MDIIWHGHSCITIKGKSATIVCDPYSGLGSKLPSFKADIVTYGDQLAEDKGERVEIEGAKVLDWPGEFEVSDVAIESFSASHNAKEGAQEGENAHVTIFAVDDIKICHMSGLSHELSTEMLDHVGDVDVLMLPVGGGDVMSAKTAKSVIDSIEPRMVIPYYYAAGDTSLNISGAEEFLKLVGKTELSPEAKITIASRSSLSDGLMEFMLLEPQS